MKHLGKYRVGCQCMYCAPNPNNKKINRALRKGARQESKKMIEKQMDERQGSEQTE